MKIVPDLSGQVFGELTVIKKLTKEEKRNYNKAENKTYYLCKCSCGEENVSSRTGLLNGRAKSCGCLKRRQAEKKAEEMIGKRFGRLVVESYELKARKSNPNKREIYYTCKCDCGGSTVTVRRNLESGISQSCGCLSKEAMQSYINSIKIDLTGKKFGKLTVIQQSKEHGSHGQAKWECQCDCGSKIVAWGQSLRERRTPSCGCLISSGEEKIAALLSQVGIQFTREQTFSGLKSKKQRNCYYRYDFGVRDKDGKLSYIIEYDGEQHFWMKYYSGWSTEETILKNHYRDIEKNQYCFDNNIPIIRIPFSHKDEIRIDDLLLELSPFVISSKEDMEEYVKKYSPGKSLLEKCC